MWQSDELKNHLESEFTVQTQSALTVEINMNIPGNIFKLGNYRYRKNSTQFSVLPNFFDRFDAGNFYTNATYSDITIESGLETDNLTPLLFTSTKDKEELYYSLEDCIKPFRPRSGINRASFFNGKFFSHPNQNMYRRPRYYMSHRDDAFRYWRSYRTESKALQDGYINIVSSEIPIYMDLNNSNVEYGISKNSTTALVPGSRLVYEIDDAVPFVVYKEAVPANRLVLKVQTNVGDIDLGPFKNSSGSSFEDPFYGEENKTVPKVFKIQYLDTDDKWIDAYSFNNESLREDNSAIFESDGYLSLEYGLEIPTDYKNNFLLVGTITSASVLPTSNVKGHSYLLKTSELAKGTLYIWNGTSYTQVIPQYKWQIGTDGTYENTHFITDATNPPYFNQNNDNRAIYREFVFLKGIRVVVDTMNVANVPLELIEFSPRLVADLTNNLIDFKVTKALSDLGNAGLPVGQILVGTGSLSLFDPDQSFNINNAWNGTSGSILAEYMHKNIKFNFYEVIKNVNENNYYIPIKTLYSEGVPQVDKGTSTINFNLRDFYFYFESMKAPQILISDVSLSQAVALLLDSIGFSNYVFKRLDGHLDPIIPYFFIPPETNVAEILQQIAVATQSAMFFDEYNNFVVMTKEYMLDDTTERPVDSILYGSNQPQKIGINENVYSGALSNIVSASALDQKVYNDGNIVYTERYIDRTYASFSQRNKADSDKTWIYKPSLLWEVSGSQNTKSANSGEQSAYGLAAVPLNSSLPALLPTVKNHALINNILDVGENAYWLFRYDGYFYSNGEIIRYDAVEHNITGTGNVWISSNLEYQKYFSSLPFNGKIYPTGNIRIYSEPYYETFNGITQLKNGDVAFHGREQFGTTIQNHNAGLDPYWSNNSYVQGCDMQSEFLYTTIIDVVNDPSFPATTSGAAGIDKVEAEKSTRNGIIKNYMSAGFATETDTAFLKSAVTGTVQSSALVFKGPTIYDTGTKARDKISYVWKQLDRPFKHFGTRLRIIGEITTGASTDQQPLGSTTYFNVPGVDPTQTVSLGGGSAGVCIANPTTNEGYYFELAALTTSDIESFLTKDTNGNALINLDNILFYKIQKNSASSRAVPIKIWGGIGSVIVNDGFFTGQNRIFNEDNPTVYDIAIEYVDLSSTQREFYLYINNKLVQRIIDNSPIPLAGNTMGLFVRGSTKAMFENIYALGDNYSNDSSTQTGYALSSIFGDADSFINANEALTKYAISGMVQKTYMQGLNPLCPPLYNMYFEEFGTIMREMSYFNIKYDKAYPALYAKLVPTFNRLKGYTVSGFSSDSYGAEFLIFNNTDTFLYLDSSSSNYLRITGVTFTQDTTHTYTVDDYYKKRGNLSDPQLSGANIIDSPQRSIEEYNDIKTSRIKYGKNEFSLQSGYIQTQNGAEDLLGWIIKKLSRPRKLASLEIFSNPMIQLGDILNINYKTEDGIDIISSEDLRYVVYQIDYSKTLDGPNMVLYVSEV